MKKIMKKYWYLFALVILACGLLLWGILGGGKKGGDCGKGHTVVIDPAVKATCLQTGLSEGKHCSVCKEVLVEQTETPLGDHVYVDQKCHYCGVWKLSEGLEYERNADGRSYRVDGIGTCTDPIVVIPATYDGLPVTSIDALAFEGCRNLKNVILPESIVQINANAFGACKALTELNLPDHITALGNGAFNNCTKLENIHLPSSIGSIPAGLLNTCTALKSIEIPKGVKSIGASAFASCESLTELVIPEAVASIDAAAFSGCRKLKSLVIPVSLKTVAAGAFRDCNALTEIYYMGSEADWNQITIVDQYNDALTSATRYFYSETQPTQSGSYWRYVDGVPTKW